MMMIKTFITSILIKEGKAYVEGKKIQIRKIQGKKSFTLSMIRCSISKPWITRGIQKTSHFCYLNTFYVLNVKTLNLYTTDSTILEIKYPVKVSSKYIYQVPTYPGTFEITDCGIVNQENDHFQNLERLLFLLQSIT